MWLPSVALAMPLQRAVEEVLDDPVLAGASVSVWIGPPGAPAAAVDPDRRVLPASVTKLVTAAVVADALPLDATLETAVWATGPIADGVLTGDLLVEGAGDPSLGVPDPAAPLDAVVAAARHAGVRRITGGVVADGSVFAGPPSGAGWMWDDLTSPWSPAVTGLSYARGLAVEGCAARGGPGSPAVDPPACFADALTRALRAAGIEVAAEGRTGEATPPAGPPLAVWRSPPVRDLLRTTLQESDNLYAESLWRLADPARPATAAGARAAVAAHLAAVGSGDRAPVDGSGLSRYSLLSARGLVLVADAAARDPEGAALLDLLPVAGRSGTLAGRMTGTAAEGRVVAKTGSMTGVRALAGWVDTGDGERWPFAVCFAGFLAPQAEVIALQDRLLALAAASRGGQVPRGAVRLRGRDTSEGGG